MATVLDALSFDGVSGRAQIDFGHFRTNTVWTRGCFLKLNTLAPGADGTIVESRRQSNHGPNTGARFDDSANQIDLYQNASSIGDVSGATTDWLLIVETCDGSQNVTLWVIDVATGTTIGSTTQSTTSSFSHSEPQWTYFGAAYNGTAEAANLDGLVCLMFALKGTQLSESALQDIATDPLNEFDMLAQTYGTSFYGIDDTLVDIGDNGATLTLTGVSWGSGNGPTVTDRTGAVGNGPAITAADFFEILYEKQQRVGIAGSGFGTTEPLVYLAATDIATSGDSLVLNSNSDTALEIKEIVLSTLSPGLLYLHVVNQTPGDEFGLSDSIPVLVNADPGISNVVIRVGIDPVNLETSTAISTIEAAKHFFKRNAQGSLTYTATGLPTGLSIASATGIVTGTPTAGSYTTTIRATDPNGDWVETSFSWSISSATTTGRSPGSWGRRAA